MCSKLRAPSTAAYRRARHAASPLPATLERPQYKEQQVDGIPGYVVRQQCYAIADLVQLEHLMVDQPVEELEAARAKETPGPCSTRGQCIKSP
jgi:hypothetical protein